MTTDPTSPTRIRTGMAATPARADHAGSAPLQRHGLAAVDRRLRQFLIAGIAAQAAAGRINDAAAALAGGLGAGAVIGTGLFTGAWAVGYGTSVGELALMGAITGLPVGAAQAFLLRGRVARSWMWAAAMPLLWALGWTVTAAAGVGVDRQYAVFGAFGAITFMALSGVVLDRLRAATPAAPSPPHGPPTATA